MALFLYLFAVPYLLYLSFKKKYQRSIPARFFLKGNPSFEKNGIWFHACSFGEARSLKPIIEKIEEDINISVITNTGYEEAKKITKNVRFLPFEIFLPFWIKKQKVLVVLEAELWLMMFFCAFSKGVKTVLINARISDNSYKNYKRFSWFYSFLFKYVNLVFCQSDQDKQRLQELGAKNITVAGNIKSFQNIKITKEYKKPEKTLITLASTHEGEEELILENLDTKDVKVIVVPRHPERFQGVDKYLKEFTKKRGLSYHKISQKDDFDSDVVLCDVMGELINIYAVTDITILGGSFFDGIGGHNPLEPAYFHTGLISGKYVFNQNTLLKTIDNFQLIDIGDLQKAVKKAEKLKSFIKEEGDIEPILKAINDKQ